MQSVSAVGRGQTRLLEDSGHGASPGKILLGVIDALDVAGIPYCLLHGYERYPERVESDVDGILHSKVTPRRLVSLLHAHRGRIGAEVVTWRDYYVVLAGKGADGSPCLLRLDVGVDFELGGRRFYTSGEVLESRRWHRQFRVPAAHVEFGCYLLKKVMKGRLEDEHGRSLSDLYERDPDGCRRQLARFFGGASAAQITAAAASGDWALLRPSLARLGAELRRRHACRALGNWACRMAGRAKQVYRPDTGLEVVFLGPDGAGKSSVVQAARGQLGEAFARTACRRFPPALLSRLLRRPEPPSEKNPHGAPPRSWLASVVRAVGYWFGYCGPGYWVTVRMELARSTLVLHDRHLVDVLVDPLRYLYGGPAWLPRLLFRLVHKPDLVILLDAPAEVLHSRKQEVPFEETGRQREAYLALVGSMRNGHVVDANRPPEQVSGAVAEVILRHQADRVASRLGLGRKG
jgi:thymidylate kinase